MEHDQPRGIDLDRHITVEEQDDGRWVATLPWSRVEVARESEAEALAAFFQEYLAAIGTDPEEQEAFERRLKEAPDEMPTDVSADVQQMKDSPWAKMRAEEQEREASVDQDSDCS